MLIWLKYLDRVIRGEATRPSALRDGAIEQPVGGLVVIGAILGALYGLCMGSFALFQKGHAPFLQLIATTIKVPALFFLTLVVTFPSLYVFNALVGSKLSLLSVLRLLVISLAVMLTVLASLGPIVAFFSASTTSYAFMLLLNVVFFVVAGFLGLRCMLTTLNRLSIASQTPPISIHLPSEAPVIPHLPLQASPAAPPGNAATSTLDSPTRSPGRDVLTVFRVWIVVFGLVGAQMAWVLRPFLGSPDHVFSVFRPRGSNFFEAILYAIQHLFK